MSPATPTVAAVRRDDPGDRERVQTDEKQHAKRGSGLQDTAFRSGRDSLLAICLFRSADRHSFRGERGHQQHIEVARGAVMTLFPRGE
jgi:hypothetical protein